VRTAAFDADGVPTTYDDRDGEALRAARCGLGTMGIVLSVELRTVPVPRARDRAARGREVADALRLSAIIRSRSSHRAARRKIVVWAARTGGGIPVVGPRTWFFRAFNVPRRRRRVPPPAEDVPLVRRMGRAR
jgi:FAD/FMN-containing dehydrogenase